MKILILGGTGAIGTFLVQNLVQNGNDIFVTTRIAANHNVTSGQNITYIQGNAHNIGFIKKLVDMRWDVIVDFMSYSTKEFECRYKMLLSSTGHYIFLSSARVYADSDKPITEDSPRLLDVCSDKQFLLTDDYALAKARQENLLETSGSTNWTIIRPYITYSDERMQLGVFEKEYWLDRAIQGKKIVFSRDIAEHYTTMTYGGDVACGIAMLVGNSKAMSQAFQITGYQSMLWKNVLEIYLDTLEKYFGIMSDVHWIDNMCLMEKFMGGNYSIRYDRLYDRRFDSSKLERISGKKISYTPIEIGLGKCLFNFIRNRKSCRQASWPIVGYMDKLTGEVTSITAAPSLKHKLGYLIVRYLPFSLSYAAFRLVKK